jgi:hypothetical protein
MGLNLVKESITGELKEAALAIFWLSFAISGIANMLELFSFCFNATFVPSIC